MEETATYRPAVAREDGAWDFYSSVRTEHRIISPQQAQQWLADCKLEGVQRDANETFVRTYAKTLERHEMRLDSICFGHYRGRMYLVNGQHRLLACALSGIELETAIIHFDARDMDHIAWMYLGLDAGNPRKLRDRIQSSRFDTILHMPVSQLAKAAAALKHVATGFKVRSAAERKHETYAKSADLPLIAVRQWEDQIVSYFSVFPKKRNSMSLGLERQGVIAAFLVLLRPGIGRPEEALRFLQRTVENDGLRRNEPAWALAETLRTSERIGDKGAPTAARRVALAWNAYLGGRDIERLNISLMPVKSPIKFDGTRYDGKQHYEESFEVDE